jgi:hypothetical protein
VILQLSVRRPFEDIYVESHFGTAPVLELDAKICQVPPLDVFLPVGAPCLNGVPSSRTGPNFVIQF